MGLVTRMTRIMKRVIILAAAAICLAACTQNIEGNLGILASDVVFTGSFHQEDNTRVYLDSNQDMFWHEDDLVSIFTSTINQQYRFTGKTGNTVGDFEFVSGSSSTGGTIARNYAVYPYNAATTLTTDGQLTLELPAVQQYAAGTFGKGANSMVAVTESLSSQNLSFRNLCGYVVVKLYGSATVKRMELRGNNGEKIAGKATCTPEYGSAPAVEMSAEEATDAITIDCGEGIALSDNENEPTEFWFVVPPVTFSQGFTIRLTTTEYEVYERTTNASRTVTRNLVNKMKASDVSNFQKVQITVENISETGTANCYIISAPGRYSFNATVKGHTTESVGTPASAEVLWESFGTDVAPNVGDIINNVSYEEGFVTFSTPETLANGNAVIAVKDADGTILWSWHIWVCDGFDPDATAQVYNNNAGTLMDRNLGATSATPGDVHSLGLLYQWGRKDPFMSGSGISSNTQAATTNTWPVAVTSDETTGTIEYVIQHPTTFVGRNSTNDWYYTSSSTTDQTRWQTSDKEKGLYDPCPNGYRVPDGGERGVWAMAFGSSATFTAAANWDSSNLGMDFSKTNKKLGSSNSIWHPTAGGLGYDVGTLRSVGSNGYYWSCTPTVNNSCSWYFDNNGSIYPSSVSRRAGGRSIRCKKEGTGESGGAYVPVTSITISSSSLSLETLATSKLTATVNPSGASFKIVSWSTNKSSVATVSNGTVTAVGVGTATITASCEGKTATCTVTVTQSFWSYILSKYDSNKDGTMSSTEIAAVTSLSISGKTFKNYSGIEKLTALKTLNIGDNTAVTSLDVSKNTALTSIYAGGCTSLASIKVAAYSSMPCVLVNKTTKFLAGSSTKTLSCSSQFIVMANGSTPLALNLTATTGKYTASGVPTKAQATVLCNKYASYKNLLDTAGKSSIASLDCWTSTVYRKTYEAESLASIAVYTFRLSKTSFSYNKGYQAGISQYNGGPYMVGNILKVKGLS